MSTVESEENEVVVIDESDETSDVSGTETIVTPKVKVAAPPRTVPGLSKKAGELLEKLEKRGIDLQKEMFAGRNPLDNKKPAFLHLIIDMLLVNKRLPRNAIVNSFKERLGWNDASAQSHASICQSLLTHLNIVKVEGGVFVMGQP